MFLRKSIWLTVSTLLFMGVQKVFSQSEAMVYEPFDYALLTPLNWAEGGEGWETEWNRAVGDDIIIREGNLPYEGWDIEPGNHLSIDFVRAGLRYNRKIELIPDDGGTLWASVIMNFLPGNNVNNVGNITLTRNGNQVITFGQKYGNQRFGLVWPGATQYNTDIPTEGLHWLVVKIQFSGDNGPEQAWLWVDPPTEAEPLEAEADLAVPQPGFPNLSLNFGIDGVQVKAEGNAPLRMDMDELRLGRTFAAVSPFLLTSSTAPEQAAGLFLFPNPTKSAFHVRGLKEAGQLMIYDMNGRLIRSQSVKAGTNTIPISYLSTGPYAIKIVTRKEMHSQLLIVE